MTDVQKYEEGSEATQLCGGGPRSSTAYQPLVDLIASKVSRVSILTAAGGTDDVDYTDRLNLAIGDRVRHLKFGVV